MKRFKSTTKEQIIEAFGGPIICKDGSCADCIIHKSKLDSGIENHCGTNSGTCTSIIYRYLMEDCDLDSNKMDADKKETDSMVDHPNHYGGEDNLYETIKVIEAWDLDFNLGNAAKYISRCDYKGNKLQDLKKALWYINREIENIERKTV